MQLGRRRLPAALRPGLPAQCPISGMDTEEGAKVRNLQMGKKKFNMDPKKGIEFLIGHNLVKETPEDIAAFLYKGEG